MSAHEDAVEFINLVADADSSNRMEAIEDLKFVWGEQWPAQIQNSRTLENRPCLTINETESYVRHTENQIRQQRPRIKCHPVGSGADVQEAEIITGYIRHVEEISDASHAYDWASSMALRAGWGYWRLRPDYIAEDSFDQDAFIDPIENIFSVYFDPNSTLPDGSDAEKCVITDKMSKTEFQRQFPGAEMAGFVKTAAGDVTAEWVGQHDIRLAELFEIEKKKATLLALANPQGGEPISMFDDDFEKLQKASPETFKASGLKVIGDRPSHKRVVRWSKVSGFETLKTQIMPGRWIPVIPVYGGIMLIEGKRKKFGMVKFAKDPARLNNFWQTAITESMALAPKAKWTMYAGQDEGYENEWAQANISARPILHHLPVQGPDGQTLPPPVRQQPEPPPEGAMVAAMGASQMLQRVMGMFDPAVRGGAQRKSDKTINAEAQQSELSNFHFYDNLTRSQKHTGRVILSWMPVLIDRPNRLQRIIGADSRAKMVTLNQSHDDKGVALERVLHDVRVGNWDVFMETGPGYNSKRQESLTTFMQMLDTPLGEIMGQTSGDLIVRMVDASGADAIADRMAAANPLANIDEASDIPPKAQMMIKGLQDQVQKMGQALQAAGTEIKFKHGLQEIKEDGATKRELLKQTAKAHDIEMIASTKRHDTEVRAQSVMSAAEIKAMTDLMLKHIDTAQLREEIEARNTEQNAKEAEHESPST